MKFKRAVLPVDDEDAEIEIAECQALGGLVNLVQGTAIAHECCCETIDMTRTLMFDKSEKIKKSSQELMLQQEEKKATEIILLLNRSRSTTIGSDREGNVYWVFCGARVLYVNSPLAASGSTPMKVTQAACYPGQTCHNLTRNLHPGTVTT